MKYPEYKVISVIVPVTQAAEDWEKALPGLDGTLWTSDKVRLEDLLKPEYRRDLGGLILEALFRAL